MIVGARNLALFLVCVSFAFAQEVLTNQTVIKLVSAGLSEDVIVGMVNQQAGKYSTGPDDVLALKQQHVPDKIIAAMVNKGSQAAPQPAAANAAPAGMPTEVGVYFKKGESWVELLPEIVNWKTGGVFKNIATAGIVKGDVNGRINGTNSRNSVKTPLEFLVYTPEGVAITEYQLIRLRPQKDGREFRTVTGGVLHVSGGATRDLVPFEGKRAASRTFLVVLPPLGAGEYGFLPPGAVSSSHASASLGKMFTFRLIE